VQLAFRALLASREPQVGELLELLDLQVLLELLASRALQELPEAQY
jgi:hypothetical protein